MGNVLAYTVRRCDVCSAWGGAWTRATSPGPEKEGTVTKRVNSGAWIAATLLALGCAGAPVADEPGTAAVPALVGKTLDGGDFDLAQARGQVVLVDFWATWCEPCKRSLPRYVALQQKYAARGLRVVAVSVDEDEAKLRRFVADKGVALTVIHDPGGAHAERWKPPKMPTAWLIGRDGAVAWVHAGYVEGDDAKVEAAIVKALGPQP